MDWLTLWNSVITPLIATVSIGIHILNFIAKRKERKEKEEALGLKVKIRKPKFAKPVEGWTPISIFFENIGRDEYEVIKMSIPKRSGFLLAKPNQPRDAPSSVPLFETASSSLTDLSWEVRPEVRNISSDKTSNSSSDNLEKASSRTMVFVKRSKKRETLFSKLLAILARRFKSPNDIEISFTYRAKSRSSQHIVISTIVNPKKQMESEAA